MKKRLSKTELEIMRFMWEADHGISPKEILAHFLERSWKKQTVSTYLKKLVNAGMIVSDGCHCYYPAVNEEEYNRSSRKLPNNVQHKPSYEFFCAVTEEIPENQMEDLRKMIDVLPDCASSDMDES